jgi:curved DNA-binding protein CbpA
MDPYEVLGITNQANSATVKEAYKMMVIRTHPDKLNGNASLFTIVKSAYDQIKRERKDARQCPSTKQLYTKFEHKGECAIKDFTNKRFNEYYSKHSLDTRSKGYGDTMQQGGTRESDSDVHGKPVNTMNTSIVKRSEPKPAEASFIHTCERLGIEKVDRTLGSGYDYARAHTKQEEHREYIDNKEYKSIGDLMTARESMSYDMTTDELKKSTKRANKRAKLEQVRMQTVRSNDVFVMSHYDRLTNFIR